MARDYFQDIVPPGESDNEVPRSRGAAPPPDADMTPVPDRSIRNINIARHAPPAAPVPRREGGHSKKWLWALAAICLLALGVLALLFLFKKTTVSVVPHSQSVLFDQTSQFTAYPAQTAASGTIAYTLQSTDIEDSEILQASGVTHKETKSSGSITVYNNYSSDTVKLLKDTRFQSSSGLIFRAPAAVSVPGKTASSPGKITITVVADKVGADYNIAANERLTLPGLQSSSAMYLGVYATTNGAFSGGFSGDAPAIPDSTLQSTRSTIEARLTTKVKNYAASFKTASGMTLTPIISFSDEPFTNETGGGVGMHIKAHVSVPVITFDQLSAAIAQVVAANTDTQKYMLVPGADFAAAVSTTSSLRGTDPISFTLSGTGKMLAQVDIAALATALAGRDQGAFQAIIGNFPGVDSAQARIEPFWNSTFPKDPAQIHITVQTPQNVQ